MLVERKVDLILQAHSHNYERSKQLANNSTACPWSRERPSDGGIDDRLGSVNTGCIVSAGSSFVKGAGSVLAVVGTGGNTNMNTINLGEPDAPFFEVPQVKQIA